MLGEELIEQILDSGLVEDEDGNAHELHSHISRADGEFLKGWVAGDPNVCKTLEVGCAYGISSLCICSVLAERDSSRHLIIDPYQHRDWHGVGIHNLQRAGYDFAELLEEPSELALPKLVASDAGTFDMAFIDGHHTLDHVMLDLFYCNRLVKVGGYIVLDDANWPSISKAITYFCNYPAYELVAEPVSEKRARRMAKRRRKRERIRRILPSSLARYLIPKALYEKYYEQDTRHKYPRMVALKKVQPDERRFDWYEPF